MLPNKNSLPCPAVLQRVQLSINGYQHFMESNKVYIYSGNEKTKNFFVSASLHGWLHYIYLMLTLN